MSSLAHYLKKFQRLRTAKVKGDTAPHKPILLLAVIEGIEKGEIKRNEIFISPELVACFKDLWCQIVDSDTFTSNFSLPFYHLKSEGFWHLQTKQAREIILTSSHSIRSFSYLREVIDYAYLDESLFNLLINAETRVLLKQVLLSTYFPGEQIESKPGMIQAIAEEILHEPAAVYQMKAAILDEEEIFVRGGVFKKQVPKIYNYTCCISGFRVIAQNEAQMVDACHIVPFAVSGDDTIGNGISLCPNLHRAFDRGLIAIDDDFRVIMKRFYEAENAYSIKQFEGKEILLPGQEEYRPLVENLRRHRERFGFSR